MHTQNPNNKSLSQDNENLTNKQQPDDLMDFPKNVKLKYLTFKNWSEEINIADVPCCIPDSVEQVLAVVNWAWKQNYKLRAVGQSHNWSPLILARTIKSAENTMLMDLKQNFNQVVIEKSSSFSIVKAQTGILMEELMTQMEEQGLGFTATPAPGVLTLGGVLAIGGHGTAIKALNEKNEPGHTYGSLSNSILSLSAVVWDEEKQQYILRKFKRTEAECAPLLTHLGSALILEVELQAGKNQRLRCESFTDIMGDELFAFPQNDDQRTIGSFLDKNGRVEVILFPFNLLFNSWLKVWSLSPEKPESSVETTSPYNYPFTEISDENAKYTKNLILKNPLLTPGFCAFQYLTVGTKIAIWGNGKDIWGWSKNSLLYVKPSTLRVTANGYAVLTRRQDIQRTVNAFYTQWKSMIEAYSDNWEYPINGPIEIRITGLDTPSEVMCEGAAVPSLSPLRPRPDEPEWDVAVWLDVLTLAGTDNSIEFYRELEQWLFKEFNGNYASARVEWSKGWAYSENTGWDDEEVLKKIIPKSFTDGLPDDNNWVSAVTLLNKYDPHHIFRSPFLDRLLSI
ncbi:MAG: FAD-binding protein [Enterobacteriaceae bacterium]|jgi:FAD/FMN-containing dehydrogenase|nr:FAD-binding protein [Enterobacteriaceae bacterium]